MRTRKEFLGLCQKVAHAVHKVTTLQRAQRGYRLPALCKYYA